VCGRAEVDRARDLPEHVPRQGAAGQHDARRVAHAERLRDLEDPDVGRAARQRDARREDNGARPAVDARHELPPGEVAGAELDEVRSAARRIERRELHVPDGEGELRRRTPLTKSVVA